MNDIAHKYSDKQRRFNEEMNPHLDALYNFALQLTSDPNDAKDLVQDTIVKAYRFFDSYEMGTNAKSWLFRILNNSYINDYRRKSNLPGFVDYDEVSSFFEIIRDQRTDTTDLEDMIYRDLLNDDISYALANLKEKYRSVVVLCDIEDFTYEEISNMLDLPIGTVRSRLHRGRLLLKEQLLDYARKKGYELIA
ncbi:sigma-70 family RNA polymerase sigma factor [Balneolaceae bacterium YR4-1]|uniref:Sigma-70 family RNA polymerase sigma factor n=1 Tax=Halalkalibaculum roseum TaxID=2709311 RepID=A0A6M1SUT3_9BACT|nr:sigma-70 family RNA polymerase sigma factor [Halalkalibaculum roseum]NGP76562.1 sigma-70 family RNA polymerase sigma factor [Halalkalibaculum roseum]